MIPTIFLVELKDMVNRELVSSIRYSFSTDDLFQGINLNRYETEESAEKYRILCQHKLSAEYPNAAIKVSFITLEGILAEGMETLVYAWHNLEELEVPEETKIVDQYCEQVSKRRDWLVWKKIIPISEVPEHTKLPLSVVRWICANGFLPGAEKPSGYWDVTLDALLDFDEQNESYEVDKFELNLGQDNNLLICFFEKIKDISFLQLMEKQKVLVVSRTGFGISPFTANNSYIFISKIGSKIEIKIEHFVDVERWAESDWLYPKYANTLIDQAMRKGIDGRHEGDDNISFRFTQNIEDNTALLIFLLRNLLQEISKVVDDTELTLKGGPIWDEISDKIYQKDEARFRDEVLKPLLREMGFDIVRDTHGNRGEHGRDFILECRMPFNQSVFWGLQAKCGPVSGNANSKIKSILNQIEDAFVVPYIREPGHTRTEIYISCMILAISGEFTDDAEDKIISWIQKYHFPVGALFLWDKPKIQSLISLRWGRSKT